MAPPGGASNFVIGGYSEDPTPARTNNTNSAKPPSQDVVTPSVPQPAPTQRNNQKQAPKSRCEALKSSHFNDYLVRVRVASIVGYEFQWSLFAVSVQTFFLVSIVLINRFCQTMSSKSCS